MVPNGLSIAVALGVLAGLVIGKPLGITAAAFIAVKSGVAKLPHHMRWGELHGLAWLAGIGFTMSLFISMLAFGNPQLVDTAKIVILGGSLFAGVAATVVLKTVTRRRSR
jgi:Na+:H+ antiporter, NhaA family